MKQKIITLITFSFFLIASSYAMSKNNNNYQHNNEENKKRKRNDNDLEKDKITKISKSDSIEKENLSKDKKKEIIEQIKKTIKEKKINIEINYSKILEEDICIVSKKLAQLKEDQKNDIIEMISHCTWITNLDLSNNQLTYLPSKIKNLKNLKDLNLSNNELTSIPEEIRSFENLKTLTLNNNKLTSLNNKNAINFPFNESDFLKKYNNFNPFKNLFDSREEMKNHKTLKQEYDYLCILDNIETNKKQPKNEWVIPTESIDSAAQLNLSENFLNFVKELQNRRLSLFPLSLKNLNLSNNQIASLPFELKHMVNLKKINLSHNKLLYINNNNNDVFSILPSNTRYLFISDNNLDEIPKRIFELHKLEKLDLSCNKIKQLNPQIKNLEKLEYLYLSKNLLSSLPAEIQSLKWLISLNLSENQLINLPQEIKSLGHLQELNLSKNQLATAPQKIEYLSSLRRLNLSGNKLTFFEVKNENLNRLHELNLSNNQIEFFKITQKSYPKLHELDLSNNKINIIPSEISSLKLLQYLDLSYNKITYIPPEIENLPLHILKLCGNQLTSLHSNIKNLNTLTLLDLRGNNHIIQKGSVETEWGHDELNQHFGDRVVFALYLGFELMPQETTKEDICKILDISPLRIDRHNIAICTLPDIRAKKILEGEKMLDLACDIMTDLNFFDENKSDYLSYELLASNFASDAKNQKLSNFDKIYLYTWPRITGYIRKLNNIPLHKDDINVWMMHDNQIPETQNAMSYILGEIYEEKDSDTKMSLFNQLANGLLHCPSGQAEGLCSVSYALAQKAYKNNYFKSDVYQLIAIKKNEALTSAVLQKTGKHPQNVHILSFYRDELKDELGLTSAIASFQEREGSVIMDPFSSNKWNVYKLFYDFVTPTKIIDWVMEKTETKEDKRNEKKLSNYFSSKNTSSHSEKEKNDLKNLIKQKRIQRPFTTGNIAAYLFDEKLISADEDDIRWKKYFDKSPIMSESSILTRDGVKEILIYMGFLIDDSKKEEPNTTMNSKSEESDNYETYTNYDIITD
jgi:Leucine-rich repeat (LRR) protein